MVSVLLRRRRTFDVRVTSRLDKVEAGVDTVVNDLLAVDATLLLEVRIESRLNIVEDGLPAAGGTVRTAIFDIGGPSVCRRTSHRC